MYKYRMYNIYSIYTVLMCFISMSNYYTLKIRNGIVINYNSIIYYII